MCQCIDHRGYPYIRQICRCGFWPWRSGHLGRQIERRGCYADVGHDGLYHRWRVQRAGTGPSVISFHGVRVRALQELGSRALGSAAKK